MKHRLEVISDVVCPWCYVGKRRLHIALETLACAEDIVVMWRPFELNPGLPPAGMDRQAYCRQKFGSLEYAKKLYNKVASEARADDLPIDMGSIKRTPNTRPAHRLIWFAEQHNQAEQMVDALFHAYFVRGLDIGDLEVLCDLAVEVGFEQATAEDFLNSDEAENIIREWEEGAYDIGVQGVPAFVFNGQYIFSGAQAPESIRLVLERCINKASSINGN